MDTCKNQGIGACVCSHYLDCKKTNVGPPGGGGSAGKLELGVCRRVCLRRLSAGTARGRVAMAASAFRFNELLLKVNELKKKVSKEVVEDAADSMARYSFVFYAKVQILKKLE